MLIFVKKLIMANKKYNIWKADQKCAPIEGTNYILDAPTKRWALDHVAHINGVKRGHNDMVVKMPNGEFWCASEI
jgi:hypothetical protein